MHLCESLLKHGQLLGIRVFSRKHLDVLGDIVGCTANGTDLDHYRAAEVLPGNALHGRRHRRREHVCCTVDLMRNKLRSTPGMRLAN